MGTPTLPWAATRFEPDAAGRRAGVTCGRQLPRYVRNTLRGWDWCRGRMERRNGQVRCPKCGRVAASS